MTYPISDVTRRVVYSGSLGTGPYPFLFEILTDGDIGVYKNTTLLTLSADYTVTINADGTGSVTLTSAATSTDTISIFGNKGIQRQTDFTTGGDLFANSLNDELDAQTIFAQQNSEAILRSIRAPVTDPTTIDMVLPAKADRADTVLTFDTDGNPSATSSSAFVAGLSGSILGANYVTNNATGDGSTTAFTVSVAPGSKTNIQIYIDGVYQNKASFSVSGTTVTFTQAPPLNASVEFIIGNAIGSAVGGADEVNFTQAGTGAVTRTVESKLQDVISVKDFGAVGDGVTDDRAAIQAAIDYVKTSTSRLTVDLGGQAYGISSPLVINQGDCGIANGKLLALATFASDGSGESGHEALLRVRQGLRITVSNIEFECNDLADGIVCETNGFANLYHELEIIECKNYGILLDTGTSGDQRISHCLLTGNDTPTLRTGTGIDIQTGDIKLHDTTVRYFATNLVVNGNTLLCNNCHFYNGYTGVDAGEIAANVNSVNIRIDGGSGQTFNNNYIDKGRVHIKNSFANVWSGNRYLFESSGAGHSSIFLFDAVSASSKVWPEEWVHMGGWVGNPYANGTNPCIQLTATSGGSWDSTVTSLVNNLQTAGALPSATGRADVVLPGTSTEGYLGLNNLRWAQVNTEHVSCSKLDLNSRNAELTIASGAITVDDSFHKVDTESDAATDDLDTISGGSDGQILILVAENSARTVVVKNGTGNISCGADFSLDHVEDTITLIYDDSKSKWLKIASSSNA